MSLAEIEPLPRAVVGSAMPLLAEALAQLCGRAGFSVEAHIDPAAARAAVFAAPPMIAVLDFVDGEPSGLDMLRDIRAMETPTRVIMLCIGRDGLEPLDAVELGVDGLLLRSAPIAIAAQCIAAVAAGEQWLDPRAMRAAYETLSQRQAPPSSLLTRRERDVARLVATGQRNRSIAEQLGISEGTVKMHLHNVYGKLGLESRTQLAMDTRLATMA